MEQIQPKELNLTGQDGKERTYIISKFPAIQGREIVTQYPLANMPKVGAYPISEDIMFKLMKFVAIKTDSHPIILETQALIANHVPDWETLAKLEMAMMEYNCSFFTNGKAFSFFDELCQNIIRKIIETLTPLSAQSSVQKEPASTNSGPSIP